MRSIRLHPRAALLLVVAAFVTLSARAAAEAVEYDNGEDFGRPPPRYDFRYQFQEKAGGVDQSTLILRRDVVWTFSKEWELFLRFEAPLVFNDAKGSDNPTGDTSFGLGDLLFQAALIDNPTDRFAWGGGARLVVPTATADQFGSGKYRLDPIAGVRWKLPEISQGSLFQFIFRYDNDIGGQTNRSHISQLQMGPNLNVALPQRWFVSLFPSQDIVLNCLDGHRWFVPADLMVGRNLTKKIVASLEVSVPVIKEFTLYDFKLEARLSLHF